MPDFGELVNNNSRLAIVSQHLELATDALEGKRALTVVKKKTRPRVAGLQNLVS
jgi:hypothetical protein